MRVSQDQKAFDNTLELLAKKRKKDIKNRQKEIDNIKEYYDKAVKFTKTDGEKRYYEAKLQNEKKLEESYNEGRLEFEHNQKGLKNDLEKIKSSYENEKRIYLARLRELNRSFTNQLLEREENAERKLSKIDEIHREAMLTLQDKSQKELSNLETDALKRVRDNQLRNRLKIEAQQTNFLKQLGEEGLILDQKLKQEQAKNKKEMEDLNRLQSVKRQQSFQRHNDILETKKEHHKEKIRSEDNSFRQKFNHLKTNHKELLDRVEKNFKNQIEKLIESHSKFKKTINNKLDDNFYHVNLLEPELIDNGKEYLLYLEVPPHEKESVHISARNRNIRLTLARRFEDKIVNEDGTMDRSRKSEIFAKTIKTKDIIDHDSIRQKYEDGHIIYKISKK